MTNTELDEQIAEKVMGFRLERGAMHYDGVEMPWTVFVDENGKSNNPIPYSTDLRRAWEVVEQMKAKCFSFALTDVPGISSVQRLPIAMFAKNVYPPTAYNMERWVAEGHTPAEAICLAAYRAMTEEPRT